MSALAGIRVLDLTRVLAGPWASQTLADLGADVVKIERPETGDDTRAWGPPWIQGEGTSAYFATANRNKRSVTLDLRSAEGQRIAHRLADTSDVVLENFKVGGAAKMGLDYASLSATNPRLVYCSVTGFGQDGPLAHRPGYDFAIQAMGGLMSVTGQPDGTPGAEPMKVGVAVTDIMTGLYSVIGILAALREREASGRGQHIDMALLDVTVATMANQALNHLVSGVPPTRMGNRHPNIVPYQAFPTADGHLVLAIGNDAQFRNFARIAGHIEWADDPRFRSNEARVANRERLVDEIAAVLATRTTSSWLSSLEDAGVPGSPINDLEQVFANPQVRHRGLQLELPHGNGTAPSVGNPIRLSRTPIGYPHGPPLLGEHTEQVLRERLGLSPDDVATLRSSGVL